MKKARKPQPPAAPDGPPLWPGLVADVFRYLPFHFPGEPIPPPSSLPLATLGDHIRQRAAMIEKPRFEGLPEYWAGALAGELMNWMAGRAAGGSEHAQAGIVELARKAVDWHSWSLSQGHETTCKCARKTPDMPGRVSLNPEVTADWQALLERIGQGSETPVPMKRAANEKRSKRDVYGANHRLVAHLFEYMEGYRTNGIAAAFGIPSNHPEIPARVREILSLDPLKSKGETWKAWHKLGFKIVKDFTRGHPATHEVFERPALSELMNPTGKGKPRLTRDLPAAWKALARAKSSLESGE